MFVSYPRRKLRTVAIVVSALSVSGGLCAAGTASAASQQSPPFTECPAIGASPSCEILLVVNADKTVSVLGDPAVGPFDGSDDTLVGIINDSAAAVSAVTVSGPGSGLSLFDGDGICSGDYGTWSGSSSCPYGPTGYEGPGTSFVTDPSLPDSAEVDFKGGLAPAATAYFSLEGALTSAELTAREGPLECNNVYPPGTSAASGGTPDYCIPADWNAHSITDPSAMEPLNVIISANSTVPLATILGGLLPPWESVSIGTPFTKPHGCMSEETADVTGGTQVPQAQSWRLQGCAGGNILALAGLENHIRIWNQPLPGSAAGAWFITASLEHTCFTPPFHCIDEDGYNDGAIKFVAAIISAGRHHGWTVKTRPDPRVSGSGGTGADSGAGTGLNSITYSGDVEVVTVTTGSPSTRG
jgi:hypothetical protein